MYEIKAYVREVMAEHVVDALAKVQGVASIAVVSLNEFGHLVGDESPLEKVKMVKLEVDVATETVADEVVDIIVRTSRTRDGHPGTARYWYPAWFGLFASRMVRPTKAHFNPLQASSI